MKKKSTPVLRFAFSISLLLLGVSSCAQVYFGASGGYGLPMSKQVFATDIMVSSSGSGPMGTMLVSFAKGFTVGVFSGFRFSECFQGEIAVEKFSGAKINYLLSDHSLTNETHTIERVAQGEMINIVPAVRFSAGTGRFKPYIRTGLLIGLNNKIISERIEIRQEHNTHSTEESTQVFRDGIAFGFVSGLGLNYSLNSKWSFFSELAVRGQNWSPLKSNIVKYTLNGMDKLHTIPVSYREFIYQEKNPDSASQNPDSPTVMQKAPYSFSSYSISWGVIFSLNY